MAVQFDQLAKILEKRGIPVVRIKIEWVNDGAHLRRVHRLWSFVNAGWKTFWSDANIIHTNYRQCS